MSKRPRGDASTTSGAMSAAKETYVDPSAVMDPTGHSEDVNPLGAPPLSLRAMI